MPDFPGSDRNIPSLASLGAVTVVRVVLLTFTVIVDWFAERTASGYRGGDCVLVTIADELRGGHISLVQGIFDTEAGVFLEARRIEAADVDERVRAAHVDNQVVLWNSPREDFSPLRGDQ
jgi:hypothetical protein